VRRAVLSLSLIIGTLAGEACAPDGPDGNHPPQPKLNKETDSSKEKKDDDLVSTKSPKEPTQSESGTTAPPSDLPESESSPPPPPPAAPPSDPGPPFPKEVCALGNGLYCGGNGVPGKPNELYRCIDGTPVLEQICDTECARMPPGKNDVCACAFGNGLYCGGNGVNGDADKLYRCTNGVVTLEAVCAGGCEKRPNGFNDRCF
jgi:hypothetical protein